MLDENQMKIVNSTAKNIIVNAGSGSGKTRVLIERVKHLLETGIQPHNIVAITFTNMAAEEMRERLSGTGGIGDCFIGTIHSFANKIYKSSGETYSLFTEEIQDQFMKVLVALYAKHLTLEKYLAWKDLKHKIDLGILDQYYLDGCMLPSEMFELNTFMGGNTTSEYPENIYTLCNKNRVITFDELIDKTTKYFRDMGGKIEYLFVDEFQDIGPLENQFFEALNAENNMFVGDERQSIYGFKGSDTRFFLNLMKKPNWTTYYLANNYRSGSKILDLAEQVIQQAEDIIDKKIVYKSGKKGEVVVDSQFKLTEYLKQLKDYRDWFILARSNKDIFMLEELLAKIGIPSVSFKKGQTTLSEMKKELEADKVKVLTVHTSKGLESKNVLLYGKFPIVQRSFMRNSEERKIMYVGLTRAKDKLILLN